MFHWWLFLCSAHALLVAQKPIHKISTKTHAPDVVSSLLYQYYSEVYALSDNVNKHYIANFNSIALQYTSDPFCVEQSSIRYFIKSFALDHNDYPASQCSLNLSNRFASVVTPDENFHLHVHGSQDEIPGELQQKAQSYIEDLPDIDFLFYDFSDINYDLQCLLGSHELMQVVYREKVLDVVLQVLVTVPEQCTFRTLNPEFHTQFEKSSVDVQIPVSGEFICQSGKTAYCKKSFAETGNPSYRLFE